MGAGHTPGPWVVEGDLFRDAGGDEWAVISAHADEDGREGAVLAHVNLWGLDPEGWANARLVAAAPALLEALRAFVDYYTQAGIGECRPEDEDDRDDEFSGDEVFNVRQGRAALAEANLGGRR